MISMQSRQVMALEARHFQPCFTRKPLAVARGKGSRVYDLEGKAYLDFIGSLGTCVVGHGNPVVLQAVKAQLGKIVSTSNLYYSEPQALLAKRLARVSSRIPDRNRLRPPSSSRERLRAKRESLPRSTRSMGGRWAP